MSLNKYVARGFTSSVGSGEGKWVQTSAPAAASSGATPSSNHEGGTSFVMGGGGLRGRPQGTRELSHRDSSQSDHRYSFDAHHVRHKGTARLSGASKGSDETQCLNDWMNSSRGHRVVLGIAAYAIALGVGIFLLIAAFGGDDNKSFYSAPAGFSRKMKPMWER